MSVNEPWQRCHVLRCLFIIMSRLKRQFRQLLQDTQLVGPGKSLSEVAIFFLGRECFTGLTEKEKQEIYDEHQSTLRCIARRDFLELLLENAESLVHFENSQVTTDDIVAINSRLQNEPRQAFLSAFCYAYSQVEWRRHIVKENKVICSTKCN